VAAGLRSARAAGTKKLIKTTENFVAVTARDYSTTFGEDCKDSSSQTAVNLKKLISSKSGPQKLNEEIADGCSGDGNS
jgi:hypothetical protein